MADGNATWRGLRGEKLSVYRCPSDAAEDTPAARAGGGWARGNYGANAGPGMFWAYGEGCYTRSNGQWAEAPWGASGYYPADVWGLPQGGVFTINKGKTLLAITDGTSSTAMIDELRIGPSPNDIRGAWAMGQAPASISTAHGRLDGITPNRSESGWDDVQDGDDRPEIGMGACTGCRNWQVSAKSRHPGGVVTGFADGGVRFVRNAIDGHTWFLIHSRNDGQVPADY